MNLAVILKPFFFIFQLTVNGLRGRLAVQHVDQARNLELFKFKYNMGAKYVLDHHGGIVTPSPAQVSIFKIFIRK